MTRALLLLALLIPTQALAQIACKTDQILIDAIKPGATLTSVVTSLGCPGTLRALTKNSRTLDWPTKTGRIIIYFEGVPPAEQTVTQITYRYTTN